jgi:hypothetical protein
MKLVDIFNSQAERFPDFHSSGHQQDIPHPQLRFSPPCNESEKHICGQSGATLL